VPVERPWSKDASTLSACHKKPYLNLAVALLAMRRIQERDQQRERTVPTGAYLCPHCRGCWHLTSRSKIQVPPWLKRPDRPH
jgi:hypothetical protein